MQDDLKSLLPNLEVNRRGFVVTTLAAGFALSTLPISAATITTDAKGLDAGEVKIPVADGTIPAYQAKPEGAGPFPTVLVIQEIFGVHEHIKDVCRRFAKLGYLAVAPELYARQGDASKLEDPRKLIAEIVSKVPDKQVMADIDATVAWAQASGKGDTGKLAITGFCWGGRIVWLYAAHNPKLKAGVAWYGRLVGEPTELQPTNPIDVAAKLNAPVLGLYGANDIGIPVASIDKMKAALAAAKEPSEFVVYPDTPHAFHADYRPSYRQGPAEDGWKRLLSWFKANGVA